MRRFVDDIEWNYLECPLCEQLGATEPQDSTNVTVGQLTKRWLHYSPVTNEKREF